MQSATTVDPRGMATFTSRVCAEFSDQNEVRGARADTFAQHRSVASTRRVDTKVPGTAAHRFLFALTRLRVQRKLIESQ